MFLKKIFLVVSFFISQLVNAEINMGWSVEGLTVQSDWVVSGKLVSIDSTATTKGGDQLLTCGLKVTKLFKGETKEEMIYFGARQYYNIETFYAMKDREVMVFLEQTEQALSFNGNKYFKWAIDNIGGGVPLVIDMEKINKQIFCASTFKLIKDRYMLEQTINYSLQQLEKYLKKHKAEEIKIQFLDIPEETEAMDILYSGSACFLYVPHFMFPKSEGR